jgi:hypothetical protein
MANTFKNRTLDLTDSYQDLIPAVASSTTTIVLGMRATNVDGTNSADIDVEFTDSDGSTKALLASTMPVPADSSLEVVSGKFVLETGDKIQAKASAASDIEMFVSMLEIT